MHGRYAKRTQPGDIGFRENEPIGVLLDLDKHILQYHFRGYWHQPITFNISPDQEVYPAIDCCEWSMSVSDSILAGCPGVRLTGSFRIPLSGPYSLDKQCDKSTDCSCSSSNGFHFGLFP